MSETGVKTVGIQISTDKKTVDTGSFTVSESGGLASYSSSLACFNDNGAGGGTADNGIKDGSEPTVTPSGATSTSGTVAGWGGHTAELQSPQKLQCRTML